MNSSDMRVPAGWTRVRFDEIMRRVERKVILDDGETYDCVGVRWYGMGAFRRETLLGMDIARKQQWVIRAGDVLYNKLFAWKGSFAIADKSVDGCIVSDKFPTYAADPALVDVQFLAWYFRTPQVALQAQDLSKGAAAISKLTLNPPQFWDLTIPLPPLDEQRRIVARIEALAARIAEARGLRREAMADADAMLTVARANAVLSVPRATWAPLSKFLSYIENGWSPACETRPAEDGEWGVLKVSAVTFGTYDAAQNKALPASLEPDIRYEVRAGDFLMSRANTPELVGACAVVNTTPPRLMLSDKIFRFRFAEGAQLSHRYLDQILKSPPLRVQIERSASGTSPSMKNISKDAVMRLLIPAIGAAEQERVLESLDKEQAYISKLKHLQAETAAELDALLPSVLDRAFRGEL